MRISIPQPCHEKWSEMTPNEKGAFCGVCSKTVVDFTAMSDEQVRNFFIDNTGKKTCGRFRNEQLTKENDELKNVLALSIPLWKKIAAAIFILFGSLLTSCESSSTTGKLIQSVNGEQPISIGLKDTPGTELGEPLPPKIEVTEIETTTGMIAPEIMGDIIAEPVPPVPLIDTLPVPIPDPHVMGKFVVDPPPKKECNDKKLPDL